ncbi:hypothetical protein DOTSEDRAFT_41207 [Dothistroma septosporum NZE10]|uniref:Uncharacterized protein n=1 Tax=Dothistroma septosporum (strain NZE10 / CBS 128990) TaxID=675120 RepID=N1Q509_DOTSN|nr:hypothetical protein DOTSEDRAFT_41207 [Dothistroma septosporum NZE10]
MTALLTTTLHWYRLCRPCAALRRRLSIVRVQRNAQAELDMTAENNHLPTGLALDDSLLKDRIPTTTKQQVK